jgi:hypothetical protein
MRPTDTIRTDDAETRIPTWASTPGAIFGAVLLAVAFATTTPAARIAIAAFDESEPTPVMSGAETGELVEATPTDADSESTTRPSASTPRPAKPRPVRLGGNGVWNGDWNGGWNEGWNAGPTTPSARLSRKNDRPAGLGPEWNTGRSLASRVFVGLYRHLEAGLRHLTVPAFGSTAP